MSISASAVTRMGLGGAMWVPLHTTFPAKTEQVTTISAAGTIITQLDSRTIASALDSRTIVTQLDSRTITTKLS